MTAEQRGRIEALEAEHEANVSAFAAESAAIVDRGDCVLGSRWWEPYVERDLQIMAELYAARRAASDAMLVIGVGEVPR